ncbi:hypothetical protein MTR_0030s0120 [Medicago truncatula]|uniref:Uncharacterized protein n=1 Tax=Medicago truncatula TaxID=3880 RepID=A0A072TK05_MEDTR|nr:hypothetical protein MTR_0030s0120 [Medicago truncatula]
MGDFKSFGSQTSKDDEDVLWVIILGETDVEGLLNVKVYISVGNIWVETPKGPARSPQGGPTGYRDTALLVSIGGAKGCLVSLRIPRRW